jgi:glycosyltransferase involved in cell wall biosynthesis
MDPCPLVFLEAMAEGLPGVAYYSGGVPEMVIHTQTGLLSYPGDIPHLAMNIVTLLSDTSYAQRLGDAGKQRVLAEFTPAYAAERWVHVLQEKAK